MHFSQILGDRVVVDKPQNNGKLVVNLIEGENFEVIKSIETSVLTSNKSKYNGDVFIQILGDSYVNGAFFRDAFFTKKYVPGVRLVGMRKVQGEEAEMKLSNFIFAIR